MINDRRRVAVCGFLIVSCVALVGFSAAAQDPNPPSIHSDRGAWPIRRQWNMAEMKHFSQWVEHVYKMKTTGTVEQRIAKIEGVLTDPETNLLLDPAFAGADCNPQLDRGIMRMMHASLDCAKFTQCMPAYYSYRRALPWIASYVTSSEGDVRMTPFSIPVGTLNSFTSPSVYDFFRDLTIGFSSGNYRVQPFQRNAGLSDSVPIGISKDYVMPGCINYTDGHCLLLADVDKYGELHFLNAGTADTRDIYTYNGMNVVVGIEPHKDGPPETAYEGCYQGLRAYRFPIAITDGRGNVTEVRRRTDKEMEEFGFSLEQFDKMGEMYTGQKILEKGIELQSFHELIRFRMRTAQKVIPMQFMRDYVDELVEMWHFRDTFVQNAWNDVLANGPIVYPERQPKDNIFQASGRWETWSSPSSDVDRRNKYFYLADWMDDAIDWYDRLPQYVDLSGLEKYNIKTREDLAKALIAEKQKLFNEKVVYYTNSQGQKVQMTLAEVERRLYDLSFDPNHPPELRWGAQPGSEEFKTVKQTFPTPLPNGMRVPMEESYKLEAYYRSVCQREQEESYLREMFTQGYPIRTKFDEQLAKWYTWKKGAQVQEARAVEEAPMPLVVSQYYEKRDANARTSAVPAYGNTVPSGRGARGGGFRNRQ